MNKPNIVFILVDALRAKNVGCYGYDKKTTPNIDRIAREGVIFNNAFSCINATDPSITSIFTGLYPRVHGILNHGLKVSKREVEEFNKKEIKMFHEILREEGYKTYGLDWLGRWHKRGFDYYFGKDIDKVRRKKKLGKIKEILKKIGLFNLGKRIYSFGLIRKIFGKYELYGEDLRLTKKAIEIIKKEDKPFFIFIHYWGVHYPYFCPLKYYRRFYDKKILGKSLDVIKNKEVKEFYKKLIRNEKDFSKMIARYDGAIRYVDEQVGRIINALKESKKKDSMIIITSDHGESLVEHDILFDHHGLYDVSVKVPLIIKYKDYRGKIDALVQHIDLMPTLLEMIGIKRDIDFDGYSLVPLIKGKKKRVRDFIFMEEVHLEKKRGIRNERYKLIVAKNEKEGKCLRCGVIHGGLKEFYDLKKDRDEIENIYREGDKRVRDFEKRLDEILKRLNEKSRSLKSRKEKRTKENISEEEIIKQRLKSLGYID